jgi:hypothetical protein
MSQPVTVHDLLDSLADFDKDGGASARLVALDLRVDERFLAEVWQQAARDGLIKLAGHAQEQLVYRLTPAGWAAHDGELDGA